MPSGCDRSFRSLDWYLGQVAVDISESFGYSGPGGWVWGRACGRGIVTTYPTYSV